MSFADQNDADTDFDLKSERSKRIQNIMKESLIELFNDLPSLNFLVFGPGVGTEEYVSHRLAVKNMIIDKKKQNADLPEEIDEEEIKQIIDPSSGSSLIKKILGNPASKELVMARGWDFLIILLMNIGAISEFSLFLTNPTIAPKVRLFIPERYSNSEGFVNQGPVALFKNAYDSVKTFRDAQDLLKKVCETVEDLMIFRLPHVK
jgi:hypothetical protein